MYSGIWPPSKPARMRWLPDLDFWPFCPRPDVLPLPEPSPRPTRLRSRWLPSAGRSSCSPGRVLVLDYQRFHRFLLAFPESLLALLRLTVGRLRRSQAAEEKSG